MLSLYGRNIRPGEILYNLLSRVWLRYALSAPVESTLSGEILRDQGIKGSLVVVIMTQLSNIEGVGSMIRESDDLSMVLLVYRILLVILMTIVTIPFYSIQYSFFPQMPCCVDWFMCHIYKSLSRLSRPFFATRTFSYVVGFQSLKQLTLQCKQCSFLYLCTLSRMVWKNSLGVRKIFRIQKKVIRLITMSALSGSCASKQRKF